MFRTGRCSRLLVRSSVPASALWQALCFYTSSGRPSASSVRLPLRKTQDSEGSHHSGTLCSTRMNSPGFTAVSFWTKLCTATSKEMNTSASLPLWAFTANMQRWLKGFSKEELRDVLRGPVFRRAAGDGDGGKPQGGSGGGTSNKGKNDSNKDGGAGDGDGSVPPMEDSLEERLVPITVLFVLVMFVITYILYRFSKPSGRHVGWNSLSARAGEIKAIDLYEHYAQIYTDDGSVHVGLINDPDTQHRIDDLSAAYKAARVLEANATIAAAAAADASAPTGETATPHMTPAHRDKPEELLVQMRGRPTTESALAGIGVFAWVVPFVFFPIFVMLLTRYIGSSMSMAVDATKGKSKVNDMVFKVENSSTTRFRDIAGMKEPKKEITEIVDFLRHPGRYTKLGAKIPTGALLLGPPGTGKTLLAKAVAGESGVGFIPVCGSDFVELYVGMGALRVRQLFKVAKKQRCIVYIDEIDAIGLKRQGAGHGEKQEQEQTLNELLTQLDGFSSGKRGDIMVLASSNVAQEALDPALIRPGRFDRIIHVDTPVISERIDIFKVHLSKLKLVPDKATEGAAKTARESDAGKTEEAGETAEQPTSDVSTDKATSEAISSSTSTNTEMGATSSTGTARMDSTASGELEKAAAASAESSGATTNTIAQRATEHNTTEKSMVLSKLEEEKARDAEQQEAEQQQGHDHSFDFRALLMTKTDHERALIEAYASRMSGLCPGFVGADIANVCNEGAILAAREGAANVDITHLERSIDRVLAGIEHRSRVLSTFEKNVVAHHEAGHAVAGWFLNRADPLMKVSIVPRGGSALGYAQYLPNENYMRTAKEIRDSMKVSLGGRVAERIFFDHLSTGASDDLRKVGQMAYMYVTSFSAGSVYPAPGSSSTRYVKPFGANKSNEMDVAAKQLVDDVYAETLALLTKHKADMEKLAQHLLKHEVLTFQDVVAYLGTRGERAMDKKKGV